MQSETTADAGRDFFQRYGGSAPENYERFFVPAIGAPLAEELVDLAKLRAGERELDLACGTGVVARLAAARVGGGRVTGIDPNPGMLGVARSIAAAEPIEWREGKAEAIPLPEDGVDALLCQLGFQFFADKPLAAREIRRVLAGGGRLALSVVGPMPALFRVMADALATRAGSQARAFLEQVFSVSDAQWLERCLREAGFEQASVAVRSRDLGLPAPADFLWQYVTSTPLAAGAAQLDQATRAAVEREVVAGWKPFMRDGALVLSLPILVATARG